MPIALQQFRGQLLNLWLPLGQGQKASLVFIGLITLAAIGFFGYTSTQPNFTPVFTKLNDQDAAAIVAKLKEMKIPYELASGGTTVMVPSTKVNETRLELARVGLPQSGSIGFELFDKTSFGLTDFNQKLNFQRALEGELARTIGQMSSVEQARVHLVIPKEELFSEKATPATASVVLKVKPGARLDSSAARAITNLVAGSVQGLKPENINVVDVNGTVLWQESDNTSSGGSKVAQNYLDAQARFERDTEIKIQTMLDRVLGLGRATAKVAATMDWDQIQTNRETYAPGAPRSSREVQESYGGASNTSGVPGVASNVPGQAGATSTVSGTNYAKRDITTNYELSKTVESVIRAPGSIKKLSVAVFVDNLADPNAMPAISQAVSNAAGLSQERGDTITITNLAFDRSLLESERRAMEIAQQQDLYFLGAKAAAVALSLLVALFVVRSMFGGRSGVSRARRGPTLTINEVGQPVLPGRHGSHSIQDVMAAGELKLDGANVNQSRVLQDQIVTLARTKPHTLAQLMQNWLEQDD